MVNKHQRWKRRKAKRKQQRITCSRGNNKPKGCRFNTQNATTGCIRHHRNEDADGIEKKGTRESACILRQKLSDGSVNKTIWKPRLAAAPGRQYVYMGFSQRKISRSSTYIRQNAIRFQHPDYNPDRAQKLISSSISRPVAAPAMGLRGSSPPRFCSSPPRFLYKVMLCLNK